MELKTKQIEGTLPVFRIEGIFSSKEKCEEWIKFHDQKLPSIVMSHIEIDLDPIYGEREKEMQVFRVRLNRDLHILDIQVGEEDEIPEGELFTFELLENGDIQGVFFARDLIDACKLSYIRIKETLGL